MSLLLFSVEVGMLISICVYLPTNSQLPCSQSQVQCNGTKICIYRGAVCDGQNTCGDNEDERNCGVCPNDRPVKCNATASKCISQNNVCDGADNCGNGEDELSCGVCPNDRPVKCNATASKCISQNNVCDGINHCGNGEDELSCDACKSSTIRCNGTKICIYSSAVCDGQNTCGDNEDETNCHACASGRTFCAATRTCLYDGTYRCNGLAECPINGEDEHNCASCSFNYNIRPIKCNRTGSTKCIYESDLCDNQDDCGDNEDERNCDRCPSSRPVKCNFTTSLCISGSHVCNGIQGCPDGEDEKNCATVKFTSPSNQTTLSTLSVTRFNGTEKSNNAVIGLSVTLALAGFIIIALFVIVVIVCNQLRNKNCNATSNINQKGHTNPAVDKTEDFGIGPPGGIKKLHQATVENRKTGSMLSEIDHLYASLANEKLQEQHDYTTIKVH